MTEPPPKPVPKRTRPPVRPYTDLRAGSRAFGVAAIVLGCLSGCLALAVPVFLGVDPQGRQTAMRDGAIVGATFFYLGIAVAALVFGFGAVRLRRWVRPMGAIGGVLGILGGIYFAITMAFWLSASEAEMRSARTAPPLAGIFFTVAFPIVVLVWIIVPALFFWFFRKPQVRDMLVYYDPRPRWTDGYPLPVLGLAMALAALGLYEIASAPEAIAPAFGTVFSGLPAIGVRAAECAMVLPLVPLVLRRRPGGWWGSLALWLVLAAAYGATIIRPDRIDQYRRAGFNNTQLASMAARGVAGELASVVPQAVFALAYLMYVRKYFSTPVEPAPKRKSAFPTSNRPHLP